MVQRQPYSSIFIIGYFSKSIFFFICTHCILFAYKGDCLKWEFDCKRGGTSVDALCLVCCKRLKSRLAISGSMKIKHVNKTRFKICKFSHYLKICLNSSRYVTNSRKYTTIKKKKTCFGRVFHRVFHTKHVTYFKRWKNQVDIYVITITLSKVANPLFFLSRKKGFAI